MVDRDPAAERRGPGRPRKWASEAERVRAYRQRKAEEHASVDELRVERRSLKRQLADALRGRARAESALERQTKRAERLDAEVGQLRKLVESAEAELIRLRSENWTLRTGKQPEESMRPSGSGISRQQRRAIERKQRKRSD